MTLRQISVYPWPMSEHRLALLRAAKASLQTEEKIFPQEFHPEAPGRVLSFGERPDHVCRWAPIQPSNVDNVASIAGALRFILEEDQNRPDPRWDFADWLSEVAGGPVRFLGIEEYQDGVRFR